MKKKKCIFSRVVPPSADMITFYFRKTYIPGKCSYEILLLINEAELIFKNMKCTKRKVKQKFDSFFFEKNRICIINVF